MRSGRTKAGLTQGRIAAQQQPAARVATQQPRPPAATDRCIDFTTGSPETALCTIERGRTAKTASISVDWQKQSQGTKTLDCKFKRWHYDINGAGKNIHATKAEGVIRYAAPDKGLFRVDSLVFYKGMVGDNPQYEAIPGRFGEHWVCNGKQLIEMDASKEECEIQDLPPEMQGKQIFNSPLPFVFNLDAQQIMQRYWVRLRPN